MTVSWMPFVRRTGLILGLFLVACSTQPAKPPQPCTSAADCATGEVCLNDFCTRAGPICVADQLSCDGSKVMKCRADGQGFDDQTTCAGQCEDGQCSESVCAAGEQRCDGDSLLQCSADRTKFEPISVCDLGCDEATSTCKDGVCRPNAKRCTLDGQIETCDTRGSGWTKTACNTDGPGRCTTNGLEGAAQVAWCEKIACTPGDLRCSGLDVVKCDTDGAGESLITTCEHGCENATCKVASCDPGNLRCSNDGKSLERCNDLGTGYSSQSCLVAGVGTCIATTDSTGAPSARCAQGLCEANSFRCAADKRFQCSSDGLSESVVESCVYGCATDGTCAPPACSNGEQRCNGGSIEQCMPNRRGFAFQQFCSTGCVNSAPGTARCLAAVCSPLIARCAPNGTSLERCLPDGSGFQTEACQPSEICVAGACVTPQPACVPNSVRCNGADIEACHTTDGVQYAYDKQGACLGTCSGNGSCDEAGECTPFALRIQLAAKNVSLPADGQSTFLVVSDPLIGPHGIPVPEGTLLTVSVDAMAGFSPPALLSADADTTRAGLQVPVVDGRIDFLLRAPLLPGGGTLSTSVRAQIADRATCSGVTNIVFDSAVTDRFVAEDFSTTRARDSQSAASKWNTTRGVLSMDAFDAGDGRDGDLIVTAGDIVDLTTRTANGHTFPDMASAPVLAITGDRLTIGGSMAPFSQAGTRLLVVNLRGQTGNTKPVGTYEFATVAGLEGTDLVLTKPMTRLFGAGDNSAAGLSGLNVRVFRVPQYNSVQVDGTLTASPFNGTDGGVLAFFAASTASPAAGGNQIRGNGLITMKGRGYRGASVPSSSSSGLSGEGIEGSWNTSTAIGGEGVSGGGFCCGDGDIVPTVMPSTDEAASETPGAPAPGDIVTHKYFGSGGSYATKGSSSCDFGAGSSYGESLLLNLFMGGGSGSVSQSTARTCYTKRACCRYTESDKFGQCCMTEDIVCETCLTTEYCDAKSYLWDGVYEGQPGGGIILITAAALSVTDNGMIDAGGANAIAGDYGSAGGSIYLRVQDLSVGGPGHVTAAGGVGGGDGRIRIDAVNTDLGFTANWTTPLATFVPQPPNTVQSIVALTLAQPPPGYGLASTVVLPVGSFSTPEGVVDVASAFAQSNLRLSLTEDDAQSWGFADTTGDVAFGGAGQPAFGTAVRWRITPLTGGGSTRGLAAKFLRN